MPPSWIRALIGCRVMETSTPRRQSGCDDLPKSYDIMRHNLLRQGLYDRRYLDVTRNGLVRQLCSVPRSEDCGAGQRGLHRGTRRGESAHATADEIHPLCRLGHHDRHRRIRPGTRRISPQRSIGTSWKTESTTQPTWRCSAWASPWPG